MSLIINQGKQDTSSDNNFEVIVSANETAQIVKMELDKDWPDTLNITYKIISEGKYKGRLFWDRVSFDPKGQFSWKYRNLRKAAGVPYVESENPKIDIEALLLNKAVTVELVVRKGNDGNDYQGVKYKASTIKPKAENLPISDETDVEEVPEAPVEDVEPAEDPFNDLPTDTEVDW